MPILMNRAIGRAAAWAALLFFLLAPSVASAREPRAPAPFLADAGAVILLRDGEYLPALLGAIGRARSEIVLSAFFFRTTDAGERLPDAVLRALLAAAGRGVLVTVILERGPEGDTVSRDNAATAQRLRGVAIGVCFDDPERTTHAKLAVVDGRFVFVGSHNLTQSALKYNREVSVRIDSPLLAGEALRYLRGLCR
jgi:phosphatidylserine/phosphatidylglycerophosphate/cardiolipin synthase-like enzyme